MNTNAMIDFLRMLISLMTNGRIRVCCLEQSPITQSKDLLLSPDNERQTNLAAKISIRLQYHHYASDAECRWVFTMFWASVSLSPKTVLPGLSLRGDLGDQCRLKFGKKTIAAETCEGKKTGRTVRLMMNAYYRRPNSDWALWTLLVICWCINSGTDT